MRLRIDLRSRRLESLAHATPDPLTPFELRELAIAARHRGHGIGALLHDNVIRNHSDAPGWLATHPAARAAVMLYRSRG